VVVVFYPKDDTPGCTKEACQFNDELSAFKGLGIDKLNLSLVQDLEQSGTKRTYGGR